MTHTKRFENYNNGFDYSIHNMYDEEVPVIEEELDDIVKKYSYNPQTQPNLETFVSEIYNFIKKYGGNYVNFDETHLTYTADVLQRLGYRNGRHIEHEPEFITERTITSFINLVKSIAYDEVFHNNYHKEDYYDDEEDGSER